MWNWTSYPIMGWQECQSLVPSGPIEPGCTCSPSVSENLTTLGPGWKVKSNSTQSKQEVEWENESGKFTLSGEKRRSRGRESPLEIHHFSTDSPIHMNLKVWIEKASYFKTFPEQKILDDNCSSLGLALT